MTRSPKLYFHSPCFDGIASATIARGYLTTHLAWPEPELSVASYDLRGQWASMQLSAHTAVVDFLFHPEAAFWADHHPTAFLQPRWAQAARERRGSWIYDATAPSCAGLLQRWLQERDLADERLAPLARWADKIDAADYRDVEEAIRPKEPALRIAASLAAASESDCVALVRALSSQSIDEVAREPSVSTRFAQVETSTRAGLERVRRSLHMQRTGIAMFDVDERGVLINRYAAFMFEPYARYSAGLIESDGGLRISVMRNPWLDFKSVNLGELSARFGGGGHLRVGAVRFPRQRKLDARRAFASIVDGIASAEQGASAG